MPYDPKVKEHFIPTEAERQLRGYWYDQFYDMYRIKVQSLDILGGRNLQAFWDDANYDYSVLTDDQGPNDPVRPYSSSISRDKSDVFITTLSTQMLYPSVTAQNMDQKIDRLVSRVSKSLLQHAHMNDGYPSESGNQKNGRYVHKMVVEGTVHVQDDVTADGELVSSLVPNEEVFIANFWQPNIQLQGAVIRAQLNVTYDEAEAEFGDHPRWKFCRPSFSDTWYVQRPLFKDLWAGILQKEKMQIMRVQRLASQKELLDLKRTGRIKKNAKRAIFYNIFINDVNLFEVDNLSNYKDGFYNINKGIFCKHAKPEFYWGNSMPNKIMQDKRWLDAWKTLIRYKGKLNVGKPMVSLNGQLVDEEIIVPFKITPVNDELQVQTIPGVGDPVTQADVTLMQMAEAEVDRGSVAPRSAGQTSKEKETAREVVIEEANAQKMLDSFSQELGFLQQSRAFPILLRLYQYLPKRDISLIAIPNQSLRNGKRGTLEVSFQKLPDMNPQERLQKQLELKKQETDSVKNGEPTELAFINPSYLDKLNFYISSDAAANSAAKNDIRRSEFNQNFQNVYLPNRDLFNAKEAARKFIEYNEDEESILIDEEEQQAQQAAAAQQQQMQPGAPGQAPPTQIPGGGPTPTATNPLTVLPRLPKL